MKKLWSVLTLLACIAASPALAQSYPTKPVNIIVPTAAGGLTDSLTRAIAQRLSAMWGQSVVIENRGGAGHNIGAVAVARSAPDGYTLMAVEAGTFVANPFLYSKLPYDPDDFMPISGFAATSMGLLTHPSLPVRNAREL